MTYQQIVIDNKTNKATIEWKVNNWSQWQQESPAADIIEETNSLIILEIPGHENDHGSYTPLKYTIYGVHEKRIHEGFYIYWEPDLYNEYNTKEEALLCKYAAELRKTKLSETYDMRPPKSYLKELLECHSK